MDVFVNFRVEFPEGCSLDSSPWVTCLSAAAPACSRHLSCMKQV